MTFADLHHEQAPLLLPNAWDVASALLFAAAGYGAIGTTSMGIAAAAGFPDGQHASREATIRLTGALTRLPCFISADIEDGYSDEAEDVADFVAALPVAGINIEDSSAESLVDIKLMAAKVEAIRAKSPEVFINARVDTYWLNKDANVAATVERALAYMAAGADGIFIPGTNEADVIAEVSAAIPLPVNVLAVPGTSVAALGRLGVRRVSTGSLPYRAALQTALDTAQAVRSGTAPPASQDYSALQKILRGYANPVSLP